MKKIFLFIAFITVALLFVSCKSDPKVENETAAPIEEVAYYCPMDCERGKSYNAEGKCPVCEMTLVASTDTAVDDHEGHDHSDHGGHNH
jgi:hypothetical protein